jgi:hypothetical protein
MMPEYSLMSQLNAFAQPVVKHRPSGSLKACANYMASFSLRFFPLLHAFAQDAVGTSTVTLGVGGGKIVGNPQGIDGGPAFNGTYEYRLFKYLVELFAGGGGAYFWNSNPSTTAWAVQGTLGARVAVDKQRHFWLGSTGRFSHEFGFGMQSG